MKLINKLDETVEKSLYSGQYTRNNEMMLRPVPKFDETGKELKKSERYYVFRMLYFTSDDRKYPFIVRNEHTFLKKDFEGNIKEVKRICCPTTPWAKNKIQEPVDRDYCPICKFSFEQKSDGWKNFKTLGQIDYTCLQTARETERIQAAYIPVLVISDPIYKGNNNHFKILRLAGQDGMAAFNRIKEKIHEANKLGITVFNGEEGANIALLCEKMEKIRTKKDGTPILNKETGEPQTYIANCITDVQLLSKRLHSYSIVTESNLEKLAFDETYGTAATKDQLSIFLSENWLDNGASDSDFDEDFGQNAEETVETVIENENNKPSKKVEHVSNEDDFDDNEENEEPYIHEKDVVHSDEGDEDEDDEFAGESPKDAIARITKGRIQTNSGSNKVASAVMNSVSFAKKSVSTSTGQKRAVTMKSKAELPKDLDEIRDNTLSIDPDDLPF